MAIGQLSTDEQETQSPDTRRDQCVFFVCVNKDTHNKALLWDTSKPYIRGIFISQKAFLDKRKRKAIEQLSGEIALLEAQHTKT